MTPTTADQEFEYRVQFFRQLQRRSSIAAAQALALKLPAPGEPGHELHTRLLAFLAAFEGQPGGRFTINPAFKLVPPGSSPQECQAYLEFVSRLQESGEISAGDGRFAEGRLSPFAAE